MKLIWLTDIHLNFMQDEESLLAFYEHIISTECDAILLCGDIAEAPCIRDYLLDFAETVKKPVYFVLGNHDYYHGKVKDVRKEMKELSRTHDYLKWLPEIGIKELPDDTILLGQDGWADGRYGNFEASPVTMNDSTYIKDLAEAYEDGRTSLLNKMQGLADKDAKNLKASLLAAIEKQPKRIIVVTHVPPFKEACSYKGEPTNDDYLPFFASKVTGDLLYQFAKANPHIEFLTLSGHTHHPAECTPLPNLTVKAGKAEYTNPACQGIIELTSVKSKLIAK